MVQVARARPGAYPDQVSRSPWIAQLAPDGRPARSRRTRATDVAIVGAGIAGVATAFFTLRGTDRAGAAGRAGPRRRAARPAATPGSSRPTSSGRCTTSPTSSGRAGHRGPAGVRRRARPARPDGRRGRRHRPRRAVHRPHGHVQPQPPAGASAQQPAPPGRRAAHRDLRGVGGRGVPARDPGGVRRPVHGRAAGAGARAARDDGRPVPGGAVGPQGLRQQRRCSCQQVLAYLERRYPDRLRFVDHTHVDRVVVGADGAVVHARGHLVSRVLGWCCAPTASSTTSIEDETGERIELAPEQQVVGTVGYMAAFVEERAAHAGGDELHPQHDHRRRHAVRLRHPPHLRPPGRHRHADLHGRPRAPDGGRPLRPVRRPSPARS